MKKLFVIMLATFALGGCATRGYRIEWFPTVYVNVVNNCKDSVLLVSLPYGGEVKIPYTGIERIKLQSYRHLAGVQTSSYSTNLMLTARGFARDGAFLGSASQIFHPGQSGRTDDRDWLVYNLQGGQRPCQ